MTAAEPPIDDAAPAKQDAAPPPAESDGRQELTLNELLATIRNDHDFVLELPIVWACLSLLVGRIQAMPVQVRRGDRPVELPPWVKRANPVWSWRDALSQMVWSLIFDSEMFLFPLRNRAGRVAEFVVLDPRQMTIVSIQEPNILPPVVYQYGTAVMTDVIHVRNVARPGQVHAHGPQRAASRSSQAAAMAEETMLRHFTNGARFQVVFTLPEGTSPEAKKEADRRIRAWYTGVANSYRPPVVSADVGVRPVSMTADQAQYLQISQWLEAKLAAQIFGVDPTFFRIYLSGSNLTYANMVDLDGRLYRDKLRPLAMAIEEGCGQMVAANSEFDLLEGLTLTGGPHDRAKYVDSLATINQKLGVWLVSPEQLLGALQLPPVTVDLLPELPSRLPPLAPAREGDGE